MDAIIMNVVWSDFDDITIIYVGQHIIIQWMSLLVCRICMKSVGAHSSIHSLYMEITIIIKIKLRKIRRYGISHHLLVKIKFMDKQIFTDWIIGVYKDRIIIFGLRWDGGVL